MSENNKLTKAEIIEKIAAASGDNPSEILRIINGFFGVLSDALLEGRTAELRGFGTFEIRERKGRANARNPKTGETFPIDSRLTVCLRPGRELKVGLNGKE